MYSKKCEEVLNELQVDDLVGLSPSEIAPRRAKFGENIIEGTKQKGLIKRVLETFCDPMILILLFALTVTAGVNVGKLFKTGDANFTECIGVLAAVTLSVSITAFMERKSEKAFELLQNISDKSLVKVLRGGETRLIPKSELVVGDVVFISAGDRIVADGRIIKANSLSIDESTLTGESKPRYKRADIVLSEKEHLADRINCAFSSTMCVTGSGEMVVTAVGNNTEIGKIAGELQIKNKVSAPLNEKLTRLGKWIAIIGGISAAVTFVVSAIRLYLSGNFNFDSVQEIFIESVVLIVAAVPEGLPTIVAVSLSLNVMKLAKENALIKKLVVAETAGCVSIICSDKTGTLTTNRMTVERFILPVGAETVALPSFVYDNILLNSTAGEATQNGKKALSGNPTECALIDFATKTKKVNPNDYRRKFPVVSRSEFSSENKYMSTKTRVNGDFIEFYKGSIEKLCSILHIKNDVSVLKKKADLYADEGGRIIAFAHKTQDGECLIDGIAVIVDPVRGDVKNSVCECKRAGIRVMMLTGDGENTAFAVAKKLGIAAGKNEVLNAADTEKMSDEKLISILPEISVIARSTPLTKLRVVKLLKKTGEVVAVTGDGVNDAPAIKQADIGIAMGNGSEIAKEAGDIVLLDDSFSTIIKAISFGRNVFRNFRRFVTFQLTVNFSAVATVLIALFLGLKSPFNALQLLWLNIIMDGPPALTLGLEKPTANLLGEKPKKRTDNLVDKKTALKIMLSTFYITAATSLQMLTNFMNVPQNEISTSVFSLFVLLQLFNSFNCRKTGSESVFKDFFGNKPMLAAFGLAAAVQFLITQFLGSVFGTVPLSAPTILKMLLVSFGVIAVSEISKLVYIALFKKNTKRNLKLSYMS